MVIHRRANDVSPSTGDRGTPDSAPRGNTAHPTCSELAGRLRRAREGVPTRTFSRAVIERVAELPVRDYLAHDRNRLTALRGLAASALFREQIPVCAEKGSKDLLTAGQLALACLKLLRVGPQDTFEAERVRDKDVRTALRLLQAPAEMLGKRTGGYESWPPAQTLMSDAEWIALLASYAQDLWHDPSCARLLVAYMAETPLADLDAVFSLLPTERRVTKARWAWHAELRHMHADSSDTLLKLRAACEQSREAGANGAGLDVKVRRDVMLWAAPLAMAAHCAQPRHAEDVRPHVRHPELERRLRQAAQDLHIAA